MMSLDKSQSRNTRKQPGPPDKFSAGLVHHIRQLRCDGYAIAITVDAGSLVFVLAGAPFHVTVAIRV